MNALKHAAKNKDLGDASGALKLACGTITAVALVVAWCGLSHEVLCFDLWQWEAWKSSPFVHYNQFTVESAVEGVDASHPAETVEHLERDLVDLNDAELAPKNASKDLATRVLPRLCAHGVPGPNTLEVLTRMLADGACPERFALRYAYYLMHRILEHYGRAGLGTNETVKAATSQCIKTLGEEAKIRAGVRRARRAGRRRRRRLLSIFGRRT